jgi:hypothetical protein
VHPERLVEPLTNATVIEQVDPSVQVTPLTVVDGLTSAELGMLVNTLDDPLIVLLSNVCVAAIRSTVPGAFGHVMALPPI